MPSLQIEYEICEVVSLLHLTEKMFIHITQRGNSEILFTSCVVHVSLFYKWSPLQCVTSRQQLQESKLYTTHCGNNAALGHGFIPP